MALIYVGTYAKYNAGSLFGAHLDPEDYSDKDAFIQACKDLHADEPDPELMFQDWEEIPKGMVSECHVSDELWEWLELDDDDRELLTVYRENVNIDADFDEAQEKFCGRFDSEEDWAEAFWEDTGMLQEIPEHLRFYINFESYARDARLGGDMTFVSHEGQTWAFHA